MDDASHDDHCSCGRVAGPGCIQHVINRNVKKLSRKHTQDTCLAILRDEFSADLALRK